MTAWSDAQSLVDGCSNCVEEILFSKRLAEEFYRTGLHGLHAHRHVSMAGDEYYRNVDSKPSQLYVEFQATHSRKPHIKDQTSRNIRPFPVQKFFG